MTRPKSWCPRFESGSRHLGLLRLETESPVLIGVRWLVREATTISVVVGNAGRTSRQEINVGPSSATRSTGALRSTSSLTTPTPSSPPWRAAVDRKKETRASLPSLARVRLLQPGGEPHERLDDLDVAADVASAARRGADSLRVAGSGSDPFATGEVGAHTPIDLSGLACQRRHRLGLARVGDIDHPAALREQVAHPRLAAHHLDAALDVRAEPCGQPHRAILVGREFGFRRCG